MFVTTFVPNKFITIRSKDMLGMTSEINRMILEKAKIYRRYVKHSRTYSDYQILRDITSRRKSAIKDASSNQFFRSGESLNDPELLLKKIGRSYIVFYISVKYPKFFPYVTITCFWLIPCKSEYLQLFFAKQYFLIETGSDLPADYLLTYNRLESVNLDPLKIVSVTRAFDVSKAYGWDDISVRMVKICDESLVKPLLNIFQFSSETGNFSSNWKKGNIVPVHKKDNKDLISNYRPVSLLPIFSKIYEKYICDTFYSYFFL